MQPGRPTTLAIVALVGAVLIWTAVHAQEKMGVVVMPAKSKALKVTALNAINSLMVMAVEELSGWDVVTYADVEAQLDHDQRKQLLNCDASECAVELGGALGKRYLLTAVVNKLGEKIIITLCLIDNENQKVTRAQAKGRDVEEAYDQLVEIAVRDLLKKAGIAVRAAPAAGGIAETTIGEQPTAWDAGGGDLVLVRFESTPSGATVLAGGRLICPATPCQKTFGAGTYAVGMQKERYEPAQQRVIVVKGMAPVALTLAPGFGLLSVTSEPSGLSVKVDGQVVGTTPLTRHEVSPGGHEVLVTDPRYYDKGERLAIEKGEHRELALALTPKEGLLVVTAQDTMGNDVAATVTLGGKRLGTTPLQEKVQVGTYELKVADESHKAFEQEVVVMERQKSVVAAKLQGHSNEVRQPGTSLLWLRCALGQTWTGSACRGGAAGMSWHKAVTACPGGYRLATRLELVTLLNNCRNRVGYHQLRGKLDSSHTGDCNVCAESPACYSMFGSDTGQYWSSSSVTAGRAWYVSFGADQYNRTAYVIDFDKTYSANVRCLRDRPNEARPTGPALQPSAGGCASCSATGGAVIPWAFVISCMTAVCTWRRRT